MYSFRGSLFLVTAVFSACCAIEDVKIANKMIGVKKNFFMICYNLKIGNNSNNTPHPSTCRTFAPHVNSKKGT
jgi:hypothetical protein